MLLTCVELQWSCNAFTTEILCYFSACLRGFAPVVIPLEVTLVSDKKD